MSEWKEYTLSEVLHLIGGGTPKTSIPEYWNGDIPWLSFTDFNTGRKYCYSAEKLHKFNQLTSTFIDKLRENEKQIRTLERLRDTLLPKLMSGEVRVQYDKESVA